MNKLPNSHKCTGCMSCGDVCPKDCIRFAIQKDGHFMPIVDKNECIDCLRCVKVCPVNGVKKELSLKSEQIEDKHFIYAYSDEYDTEEEALEDLEYLRDE